MSQGDPKSLINQKDKEKMLDDLESLSRMLDEEADEDEDTRVIPEDIPVLKSFVDDVPVLSETLDEDDDDTAPSNSKSEPPTLQPTDSVDLNAANFSTSPVNRPPASGGDKLDMSFLDKDPLDISDRVKNYRSGEASKTASAAPAPTPSTTPMTATGPIPATAKPAEVKPAAAKPAEVKPELAQPDSSNGAEATRPPNRFQSSAGTENPFLPRSTLDKIRENHAWQQSRSDTDDASAQLRKLLQDNPLNKLTFDPNSKEVQALRQKASQMVNDVIRANMPRLEAELRMKLEQEVDRMFKEIKKNPR